MVTEKKARIFLYDPKEVLVLFLLAVLIGVFAFTLGVHLGKKTGSQADGSASQAANTVATVPDVAPSRQELNEQQKGVATTVDETVKQALHEEVQRSGIRLDQPKQVELPADAKAKATGATAAGGTEAHTGGKPDSAPAKAESTPHAAAPAASAHDAPVKKGAFTLQVGSYATASEARQSRENLESFGLKPFVKPVELPGKGTWYRLYVGAFSSKEEAEEMGSRYQSQKQIESFIVTGQ